jgi:hypothetical protein
MSLTADDLWPLVVKLPRAERVRLARLALGHRGVDEGSDDRAAYEAMPITDEEFALADEPLRWESDGWDEFR